MSADEQTQAIGKLVQEYAATKNRLAAMRATARLQAKAMADVADFILSAYPAAFRNEAAKCGALLAPTEMRQLLEEISLEAERLKGLAVELKAVGLEVTTETLQPFKTQSTI